MPPLQILRLFPWIEQTIKAKWCSLMQTESQQKRKFDEICLVHTCIGKESIKIGRVIMRRLEKSRKKQDS